MSSYRFANLATGETTETTDDRDNYSLHKVAPCIGNAVGNFIHDKTQHSLPMLQQYRCTCVETGEFTVFSFGKTGRGEYAVRWHPELEKEAA